MTWKKSAFEGRRKKEERRALSCAVPFVRICHCKSPGEGWRGLGEDLAVQTWVPEFGSPAPPWKICNLLTEGLETGGRIPKTCWLGRSSWIVSFGFSERPHLKKVVENNRGRPVVSASALWLHRHMLTHTYSAPRARTMKKEIQPFRHLPSI